MVSVLIGVCGGSLKATSAACWLAQSVKRRSLLPPLIGKVKLYL